MFDGISELGVIGLVALIVIGPKDLPRIARTVGHVTGKLRRYVADVKSEINREMELADLKRMQEEINSAGAAINAQVASIGQDVEQSIAPEVAAVSEVLSAPVVVPVVTAVDEHLHSAPAPDDTTVAAHPAESDSDGVANDGQPDLFAAPTDKQ